MKNIIRLTENDLHRIVKNAVTRILTEGNQWIGDFGRENFNMLQQKVNDCGGACSFSLNGTDFTITPSQRGFLIQSGTDFGYESFQIDSALKAAWKYSNGVR